MEKPLGATLGRSGTHPAPGRARVVILDFGSQYTHLIARRVRECRVFSEVERYDTQADELGEDVSAIILSGGPSSIWSDDSPSPDPRIYELGVPVLGICYGMQAMSHALGGKVSPGETREYGPMRFEGDASHPLFSGVEGQTLVWMSHGDEVIEPPPGFEVLGRSADGKIAAIGSDERQLYGLQFHPEVVHTERGGDIVSNFVHGIVLVGAMVALGKADSTLGMVIGFFGVVLAAGNAVGGYVVTERMLEMFKASRERK